MAIGKNDLQARQHWGSQEYDAIPKAVFALAAWHLANLASEQLDDEQAARARFIEELTALKENGIIDGRQLNVAVKAIGLVREG